MIESANLMNIPAVPSEFADAGAWESRVETWDEFTQKVAQLKDRHSNNGLPLLFRAQSNSNWPLETTLERAKKPRMLVNDYYRLMLKVRPQIEAFTGKRWVMPTYLSVRKLTKEFDRFSLRLTSGRLPGYDYMAYLRHHGFPSPLLDWTRSLHVAGYFAFRKDEPNAQNKHVSIYVLANAKIQSGSNLEPYVCRLGPYVRTHQRHFLQQSEYTVCVSFDGEWRFETYESVFAVPNHRQVICWKFDIPFTERLTVLKTLDEYNLNAFSLLNSEESLVETMALREFQF